MNSQRPNRRMSIAVAGIGGNRPSESSDEEQASRRRRQTIAPNLKENPNHHHSNAMESSSKALDSKTEGTADLPGFANVRRSSFTQQDHSSASLNTSYVSSSSSDQSTDRLDLSELSDNMHSLPEQLVKLQQFPSRPPLADRRRQTMVPAAKRESVAEMRRERRRSMAPRIGQTTENGATSTEMMTRTAKAPVIQGQLDNDDEDVTGKLSLPALAIQDIMHQSSKQTTEDDFFDHGPPPRQSLPFDDVVEDPPKIQRALPGTTDFAGRSSYASRQTLPNTQDFDELCDLDSSIEDDELDKTANENDLKMLFGFGEETEKVDTLDTSMDAANEENATPLQNDNHAETQSLEAGVTHALDTVEASPSKRKSTQSENDGEELQSPEPTGSPREAQAVFESPQKKAHNETIQDSPARNTRSAKKPLAEPLGLSPGRSLRKSPARTKRSQSNDAGTNRSVSKSPPKYSDSSTLCLDSSNDGSKPKEGVYLPPDGCSTRQSLPPISSNEPTQLETKARSKSMTFADSKGMSSPDSRARHSLPASTSRQPPQSNCKDRAESVTPISTGITSPPESPILQGTDSEAEIPAAGKTTETMQSKTIENAELTQEIQASLSQFSTNSVNTTVTGFEDTTNDVDSAVIPLPSTMHEVIGEIESQQGKQCSDDKGKPSSQGHEENNCQEHETTREREDSFQRETESLVGKSSCLDIDQARESRVEAEGSALSFASTDSDMDLELTGELDKDNISAPEECDENTNVAPISVHRLLEANNGKLTDASQERNRSSGDAVDSRVDVQQDHDSKVLNGGVKENGCEEYAKRQLSIPAEKGLSPGMTGKPWNSLLHLGSARPLDKPSFLPRPSFDHTIRYPPRSSITPTKLLGAPARLANPLTAPTSEFKRKQAMTPKPMSAFKRRASYDHIQSETKRAKTASALKSALRCHKTSLKTKKMVNFGSPEILEFDPNESMLTPIRDERGALCQREKTESSALNVYAGGTPFRSVDTASVNLSDKLKDEEDSTDSDSFQEHEHTAALELDMNQCLDVGNDILHVNHSGSSGSSMDTTVDSTGTSTDYSFDRPPTSPHVAETVVHYSMLPDASFEVCKFDGITDKCEILVDEKQGTTLSVDLKVGELLSSDIRMAATETAPSDVLSVFIDAVRIFPGTDAVNGLLSDVIEKAIESMPLQPDYNDVVPVDECGLELIATLQQAIRRADRSLAQKLKEVFNSIRSFEKSSWNSWVLSAGQELDRVLAHRFQLVENRVKEVESIAQAIDRQVSRMTKVFSCLKLTAMETKEREVSCLTAEIEELEQRLQRAGQTCQNRNQEQHILDAVLLQMKDRADHGDALYSEQGCAESLRNLDLAAGLCKWRVRAITDSYMSLEYIGQTSETCINLSFDTSIVPIVSSISLERSLFPTKLRFARKFSTNVSAFMKHQISRLQEKFRGYHLESAAAIPGFARRLCLQLSRIDVVAMEIRALEQRHNIRVEISGKGTFQVCAFFPKDGDEPSLGATFLVSNQYPVAPPEVKIESFDKCLDLAPVHRLAKHVKAGYGGIVRTCDSMKAYCGTKKLS